MTTLKTRIGPPDRNQIKLHVQPSRLTGGWGWMLSRRTQILRFGNEADAPAALNAALHAADRVLNR